MTETRNTLFHKMPVLILVILFALYLMRVSLTMASADANSPDSTGYMYPVNNFKIALRNIAATTDTVSSYTTRTISTSAHTIAQVPGRVADVAVSVTDIPAFINPADTEHKPVPVITPVHFLEAQATSVATTPTPTPTPSSTPTLPARPAVGTASAIIQAPQTSNLYAWGNCTWWAATRRSQVGDSIPNSWGNATSWAYRASADGYVVDHIPSPGAIMQNSSMAGGLGHVAFVESVNPDGSWRVSEMNVLGLGQIDYVTATAGAAAYYYFIHDKQ